MLFDFSDWYPGKAHKSICWSFTAYFSKVRDIFKTTELVASFSLPTKEEWSLIRPYDTYPLCVSEG